MSVLFRPQRATLFEAMEEVRTVHNREDLAAHLKVNSDRLRIEPYCSDERIGWLDTHIVDIPGYGVVGFTNGPLAATAKEGQ